MPEFQACEQMALTQSTCPSKDGLEAWGVRPCVHVVPSAGVCGRGDGVSGVLHVCGVCAGPCAGERSGNELLKVPADAPGVCQLLALIPFC